MPPEAQTAETLPTGPVLQPSSLRHRSGRTYWAAILVVAAVLAGLILRLAFAARSGLWRDEAQFLFVVRMLSTAEMLDFLRWHEWHPPLFYLLMRAWFAITGDSTAAALALPLILGMVQIPVVYLIGARMFSRRAGMVAGALVAAAPWLAEYSAEVRPYSLLPLLVVSASYCLWRGLKDGGAAPWLGYAVTTLATLFTHNWSWVVLGAEWMAVGLFLGVPGGRPARTIVREWLVVQAGILLAYGPWWAALLFQVQHGGHSPRALPLPLRVGIVLAALLLGALAWWKLHQKQQGSDEMYGEQLALGLCLGVPFAAMAAAAVLSARSNLLMGKCVAMLAPNVFLALAHCLVAAPSLASPRRQRIALGGLLATFLAIGVAALGQSKSNAREVAAAVAAATRADDLIVIAPGWLASSFNYYYQPDNAQIDYPYPGRTGAVLWDDWQDRYAKPDDLRQARTLLARAHQDGQRVWLITLQDFETDAVADDETLPPWADSAPGVVQARTNQVRRYLQSLYGAPAEAVASGPPVAGTEVLRAMLFTPGPTSSTGEDRR